MLRALRVPGTGEPSPLAKLFAVLVLLGLLAITAPVAAPVLRWLSSLF
jgi:hypothetical protein